MLLDWIATNYVSFTLHEEFIGKKNQWKKETFFKHFYDAIAYSVFCCLYFAYPKSQTKITNEKVKWMLLNTFSYMFTGIEVKSAKFDHWKDEMGAGNALTTKKKTDEDRSGAYHN